uniref:Uncharacterized protein n=1 Tax=Schistocephalus solidus TaxID=70667 RepID=A0A0X3Q704_SCHSO
MEVANSIGPMHKCSYFLDKMASDYERSNQPWGKDYPYMSNTSQQNILPTFTEEFGMFESRYVDRNLRRRLLPCYAKERAKDSSVSKLDENYSSLLYAQQRTHAHQIGRTLAEKASNGPPYVPPTERFGYSPEESHLCLPPEHKPRPPGFRSAINTASAVCLGWCAPTDRTHLLKKHELSGRFFF